MAMIDRFNRPINYLRVSVTDRCNLRCHYCMPECGIDLVNHEEILSFEEIAAVVRAGAELGITKLRLTGGEPTVRKDIVLLVKILSEIKGIEEITMTTNGLLLEQLAKPLKESGLKRLNVSLDTINPEKFRTISRGGDVNKVITGIFAARSAGFNNIKINIVQSEFIDKTDIDAVKNFSNIHGFQCRFIRKMDLEQGYFSVVEGGEGGNCAICNRLRLTATGDLKPCLFSNVAFNVREYGIRNAFMLALGAKPEEGKSATNHKFYQIGG